ncbi:MAG: zf-HC2 domain-containing protein [Armatimonadota bacterium]|nr:zf-HC2 domain-containing protein [Armatimonadota bacterium]MDR7551009.1 zf-HC2 domain-containing protein [Armatimonadota bacterium]
MDPVVTNCREARGLLVEAVSGTMPPEIRRVLLRHLGTCETCRREAATLEATAGLLRAVPTPRLPGRYWEEFMAGLDRRLKVERTTARWRLQRWIRHPRHAWGASAAAAALIIGLGWAFLGRPAGPPIGPPTRLAEPLQGYMTPSVVDAMPAMDASLAVWKAGFGAPEAEPELTGSE